jgi:glucose-1-phosphate thymidylyltransferase
VYIEDGVTISYSRVGPNVSIGAGSTIAHSALEHTIVGSNARIDRATLRHSFIGDATVIEGMSGQLTIGDHSEVRVTS